MATRSSPLALPLTVSLAGVQCVCLGGGTVAARRLPALLEAGAQVRVIAPDLHSDLTPRVQAGAFQYFARRYEPGDCAGAFFVLAATGVAEIDRAVALEAHTHGALICVASEPELGNCCFMATIRRGSLVVALQTAGAAPAVTASLRASLERQLPPGIGEIVDRLGEMRRRLRSTVSEPAERARRWQLVVDSGALDAALRHDGEAHLARVEQILETGR